MSKSRWERFKDWCKVYPTMDDYIIEDIMFDIERQRQEALKQEESRLSRQIEQLSIAMSKTYTTPPHDRYKELDDILNKMIEELREVQEARIGKEQ